MEENTGEYLHVLGCLLIGFSVYGIFMRLIVLLANRTTAEIEMNECWVWNIQILIVQHIPAILVLWTHLLNTTIKRCITNLRVSSSHWPLNGTNIFFAANVTWPRTRSIFIFKCHVNEELRPKLDSQVNQLYLYHRNLDDNQPFVILSKIKNEQYVSCFWIILVLYILPGED